MISYNGKDRKAFKKALAWKAYIMREKEERRKSLRWRKRENEPCLQLRN